MENSLKKRCGGTFHCEISTFIIAIIKAPKIIQCIVKPAIKIYMNRELLNK